MKIRGKQSMYQIVFIILCSYVIVALLSNEFIDFVGGSSSLVTLSIPVAITG